MVAARLSCFVAHISLVVVFLFDVEASSCQHLVDRKVGDTVEFSSCLPTEGVTMADWKYGDSVITDGDGVVLGGHPLVGRVDLNLSTFGLTVRRLTLSDSGQFTFVSEVNNTQRQTVSISLRVHEPITTEPIIISNSTWISSNQSCSLLLDCSSSSRDSSVSYTWTTRNRTITGPRLRTILQPQDGDATFTCTTSNLVSHMSTVTTEKCSNVTSDPRPAPGTHEGSMWIAVLSASAAGGFLIILLLVSVCVCRCKQKPAACSEPNELTVYADISDAAVQKRTSSSMKTCTLYETIDERVDAVTPAPQTVYDKIQLNRMRNASLSPYQTVS